MSGLLAPMLRRSCINASGEVANVGKRSDARRRAILDLALGLSESLAQFGQRVASRQRGEQQAVGSERVAHLEEGTRQVVDELECERRHHQIDRSFAERQRLFVGRHGKLAIGHAAAGNRHVGRDDRTNLAAGGKHLAHGIGWRTEIDGAGEVAKHGGEAIGQILRDTLDQER